MTYEKILSLYRNDKTLQILRADHFPLLISFFHLAFKQQDKITYPQSGLAGLLGDYLFSLEMQGITDYTALPSDYLQKWAEQGYLRRYYDAEIAEIKKGNYTKPTETQLKEDYFLAEETARRLLSDFRQVEENFRELDTQTRQTIIKSAVAKGKLLDYIFEKQDHLWNTDQGKSFQAFWEFLMSESMQRQLDELIAKLNEIPAIRQVKQEQIVDRIKGNLVDAGDKVNRSNDGLIEQLRKFVEQKNLSESRYILIICKFV